MSNKLNIKAEDLFTKALWGPSTNELEKNLNEWLAEQQGIIVRSIDFRTAGTETVHHCSAFVVYTRDGD